MALKEGAALQYTAQTAVDVAQQGNEAARNDQIHQPNGQNGRHGLGAELQERLIVNDPHSQQQKLNGGHKKL